MNPKYRNALAEIVSLAGILEAAVPQFSASLHIPAWVGAALALVVTVGNQLWKDSTPSPCPTPGPGPVTPPPTVP